MSSTVATTPSPRPVGRPRSRMPLAELSRRLGHVLALDLQLDVRAFAGNNDTGEFTIDTNTIGDVTLLAGALGLPLAGVTVEESRDIGIVRTWHRCNDYDGWVLHIQHTMRTPMIETQEGTPSAS